MSRRTVVTCALLIVLLAGMLALLVPREPTPKIKQPLLEPQRSDHAWPAYGNDPGGRRYSRADQIQPNNVSRLGELWRYRTDDPAARIGDGYAFEATPIMVDGRLYLSTPTGIVIALDAGTGREVWRYDGVRADPAGHYAELTSRGVSYWRDPVAPQGKHCSRRIFFAGLTARLVALDAVDGEPCAGFGEAGTVNLRRGVRLRDAGDYLVTSPPAVAGDKLIVGSAIGDNRAVELEYGVVRAFDARSGAQQWAWDPLPRNRPGDPARRDWRAQQLQRTGGANAWSIISVDEQAGRVFVPTGAPSPDFYGGTRLGRNLYANSLVALDLETGKRAWHFQFVHHDLWDYDVASQPVLATLHSVGETVPAVIQATKMGLLYTFDRRTGKPLFEIQERPVPGGGVDGEQPSPTQPFPVAPPHLVPHDPVRPEDAWGLTPWDRARCAERIGALQSRGIFTPPSKQGTILRPGYAGGSNWGSVAFDPERDWVVANTMDLPMWARLVPREAAAARDDGYSEQSGTPYVMERGALMSPWALPCTAPPWGTLAAVDMNAGEIVWQVPLGTTRDVAPLGIAREFGMPNVGGPIVTATGLIFVAAAMDNYLRAFDLETGKELWKARLPAGGQATPMTYQIDGTQYVVIAAGGHDNLGTERGDYVVAFTLPEQDD